MGDRIVVAEYKDEYQEQVVDLILHIQQVEYGVAITKEDQPDLFQIRSFYQHGRGNFWVALHNSRVVGTIALLDIANQQTALRKMFVVKEYRGKTFNTAALLLGCAIEWAKKQSVKQIYLGTTLQFIAAHRFYEKHGFQEITDKQLPVNFPVMQVDKKFYQFDVHTRLL